MSQQITIVGGGLAGLSAAIACAEGGAKVRLLEAHDALGGRARSNDGPFKANLGPHALYQDGPLWQWLAERKLLPAHVGPPLAQRERREVPLGRRRAAHAAAGRDSLGAAPARS